MRVITHPLANVTPFGPGTDSKDQDLHLNEREEIYSHPKIGGCVQGQMRQGILCMNTLGQQLESNWVSNSGLPIRLRSP